MPYLKPENRHYLECIARQLGRSIGVQGDLNFVISCMADEMVKKLGVCYATLSMVTADINNANLEFYRRVVGPYEDLKIKENGDVFSKAILTEEY